MNEHFCLLCANFLEICVFIFHFLTNADLYSKYSFRNFINNVINKRKIMKIKYGRVSGS